MENTTLSRTKINGGYLPGNDAAVAVEGHICVEVKGCLLSCVVVLLWEVNDHVSAGGARGARQLN